MNNLQLYATYYHSMGMNVAPIYGRDDDPSTFKKPGVDINKWHRERQSIEDIMSFNWVDATGIGLITGFNGIRAIDIDSIKDTKILEEPYKNKIIGRILKQLNLPDDYQWVVKSGSGKGCHIIFQSDYLPDMQRDNFAFATMDSRSVLDYGIITTDFKSMEISWNFFLVLPPSMYKDCKESYMFWYRDFPSSKPSRISNDNLINLIDYWFGYDCKEEWLFENNKFDIHYRKFNTTYDSSRIKDAAEIEDFRGLLMICDEGRNTLAFKHDKYRLKLNIFLDLLKSSNCSHSRLNLVNLMAVGYIKVNYNEFHKSLKDLVNDGIIEEGELEELEERGRKNCKHPNRLMFFDTETNGLPPKYDPYLTSQPRIVQLSWVVADENKKKKKKCGYLIKPVDFDIPEDAVKVHGITKMKAMRDGVLIQEALSLFLTDLAKCNALVGHNVSYDIQVLRGELERFKIANVVQELPYYCTMRLSVDYCKIPTEAAYIRNFSQYISYSLRHPHEYKYKFPKLLELYEFLFDERFDNAHDANADVEATVKCFYELLKRKIFMYKTTEKTYEEILTLKSKVN